ncbi:hypothetical protein [Kribbella qitaiheensis]|uniref:hypothetical protein n=1 Tax=Kribbella qitaiheensis TaxID=1544730 RepID=UPI001FE26D00|nr:hypothetical protein [Kribbella qitaiheensis]
MTYSAKSLADMLDGEMSWLSVRTADALPGPEWISCAALLAEQQAGGDPTYEWRKALRDDYGRDYDIEPPEQVAAMFVLMWYVSVPSIVAALSAAIAGVSPDVSPESVAFRRHPTAHYPTDVALLSDGVVSMHEAAAQVAKHTRAFTDSYRPWREAQLPAASRRGRGRAPRRASRSNGCPAPDGGRRGLPDRPGPIHPYVVLLLLRPPQRQRLRRLPPGEVRISLRAQRACSTTGGGRAGRLAQERLGREVRYPA